MSNKLDGSLCKTGITYLHLFMIWMKLVLMLYWSIASHEYNQQFSRHMVYHCCHALLGYAPQDAQAIDGRSLVFSESFLGSWFTTQVVITSSDQFFEWLSYHLGVKFALRHLGVTQLVIGVRGSCMVVGYAQVINLSQHAQATYNLSFLLWPISWVLG